MFKALQKGNRLGGPTKSGTSFLTSSYGIGSLSTNLKSQAQEIDEVLGLDYGLID